MDRRKLLNVYVENFIIHRNQWEAEWSRTNRCGLSSAQGGLITLLMEKGPLQAKDLMFRLGVSSGGVTVITNNLIQKGLISRVKSDTDKRAVYFELTERGKELYPIVELDTNQVMDRIFSELSDIEVAILAQLFGKLSGKS
ncbi:MarR family winged helix-turn-helix transcriptional regulator [Cohnella caldifontis]|uniref:MarR family winged helix-turn-helix transcriptional regulator n=1 Tax=Cohnella caldifontis TaxID=3027471 RepID=UPI0023ECACBB|nr:MarR family transcriptional regulator [Cohnella sp. YIM B05605]